MSEWSTLKSLDTELSHCLWSIHIKISKYNAYILLMQQSRGYPLESSSSLLALRHSVRVLIADQKQLFLRTFATSTVSSPQHTPGWKWQTRTFISVIFFFLSSWATNSLSVKIPHITSFLCLFLSHASMR